MTGLIRGFGRGKKYIVGGKEASTPLTTLMKIP
jgi:hypothetical protein